MSQLLPDVGIEIAFIGRSNSGKSSAINAITRKGLAKSSKTPGRTRLINFFSVGTHERLVDLPGYGFANVSKEMQAHWQQLISHYLEKRRSLKGIVILMDIRHPLQASDQQLLAWLEHTEAGVHVLLTKADKLSKNAAMSVLKKTQSFLDANFKKPISAQIFSANTRQGMEQLYERLNGWFVTESQKGLEE